MTIWPKAVWAIIALIAICLYLADGADASPVPETSAAGEFMNAANTYWERVHVGHAPACGASVVTFFTDDEFATRFPQPDFDPANSGYGDTPGCRIWIKRSMWQAYNNDSLADRRILCDFITHERGHNYGLKHEIFPIMVGEYGTVPECGGEEDAAVLAAAQATAQAIAHRRAVRALIRAHRKMQRRVARAQRKSGGAAFILKTVR